MDFPNITINDEQANEIAKTIFADIDDFVKEHYEEYLAFCKSEGYEESEVMSDENISESKQSA